MMTYEEEIKKRKEIEKRIADLKTSLAKIISPVRAVKIEGAIKALEWVLNDG